MTSPEIQARARRRVSPEPTREMALEAVNGTIKKTAAKYGISTQRLRKAMVAAGFAIPGVGGRAAHRAPFAPARHTAAMERTISMSKAKESGAARAARFWVLSMTGTLLSFGSDRAACERRAAALGNGAWVQDRRAK